MNYVKSVIMAIVVITLFTYILFFMPIIVITDEEHKNESQWEEINTQLGELGEAMKEFKP